MFSKRNLFEVIFTPDFLCGYSFIARVIDLGFPYKLLKEYKKHA